MFSEIWGKDQPSKHFLDLPKIIVTQQHVPQNNSEKIRNGQFEHRL
jgi:hypothetical protein